MEQQKRVYVALQQKDQGFNVVRVRSCVYKAIPVLCEVREDELRAFAVREHEGRTTCCNLVWVMSAVGEVLKQAPQSEERVVQVCRVQRADISQERRLDFLAVWVLGEPRSQVPCELLQPREAWLVRVQASWFGEPRVVPVSLRRKGSSQLMDGMER